MQSAATCGGWQANASDARQVACLGAARRGGPLYSPANDSKQD
jgi:hypothetical protein